MGRGRRDLPLGYAALTSARLLAVVGVLSLASAAWGQGRAPLDVEDALGACRRQLIAHEESAATCYDAIATDARVTAEDAAVAAELAEVARALSPSVVVVEEVPAAQQQVSVSALVESGAPELVLSSAAYGGVAGFLASATALSATRISQLDSLPWLIGVPALGILAGGAAGSAAAYALDLDAGDAALVSSTLWVGTAWGTGLQLVLFDQADDVGHIPLRFATVLGTGLGLGAVGVASAWAFDIDPGDVGLSNSAALWGAVLGGLTYLSLGSSGLLTLEVDHPLARAPGFVGVPLVTSVLPWLTVLALHPLLDVSRPATWLIEGGGLAGLLGGFAVVALLGNLWLPSFVVPSTLTLTTAAGVAGGTALAFVLSSAIDEHDLLERFTSRLLSVTPAILPPAPGRVDVAPGFLATVRF